MNNNQISLELKAETSLVIQKANNFAITDELTLNEGSLLTANLRKMANILEAHKKARTGPINEALKLIRSDYKVYEDQLEQAEAIMDSKIIAFHKQLKEEADRKRQELLANIDPLADDAELDKQLAEIKPDKTLAGNVGFINRKDVEIMDETMVPDEYWIIDMKALKAAALKIPRKAIPGVRVILVDGIVKRSA